MKSKIFFGIIAILCSIGSVAVFNACSDPKPEPNLSAILKDLKEDTYYLKFDNNTDKKLIDKDEYGKLSPWTSVPAASVGFKVPGYERIPIYKLIWPTCPTMLPNIDIAKKFIDLAKMAKLNQAEQLQAIQLDNGALIANEATLKMLSSYEADKIDTEVMKGVTLADIAICPDPPMGNFGRRPVYALPLPDWKDLLDRIKIRVGCRDPRALELVRSNLLTLDKVAFASYNIEKINENTAILTNSAAR